MTTKRTRGNQDACECPACGTEIRDLWDLGSGLCDDGVVTCDHCGREIGIEAVEIVAYVTLAWVEPVLDEPVQRNLRDYEEARA